MKKNFLFTLLIAFFGVFVANATEVTINVDKASNVTVSTANQNDIPLVDGKNTISMGPDDNPITIKANPGAEIVSVIANGNESTPSMDGAYRVGVGGPTFEVNITTKGEGSAPSEKLINFNVWAVGEGITGNPFNIFIKKDGKWVPADPGDYNMTCKAPENAEMKITPVAPYEIETAIIQNESEPIEFTREADGSILFLNVIPDYFALNLHMKLSDKAVTFTIQVDYPGNVDAYMEWQRTGEHNWDKLVLTGNDKFCVVDDANPLEFIPSTGADIVQVTLNGEVAQPIGWGGSGGYVFSVKNGDAFVVSTKGPEIEMLVKAPEGQADLSAYYFTKNDGTQIKLSGNEAKLKGNQGEYIYVSGRPGTKYDSLMGVNGADYDMATWKNWFRVTPGADGKNPAEILLYGSRNVTGVAIDVDAAARVSVVQEGGRGDALTLKDGVNSFALADLKNALAISSAEGNQITSVTLNGDAVTANAQGLYLVNVAESDYVQVKSRKNPVDMTLTFELNEGASINWLKMQINGQDVESANPITVKSYSTVTVSAAPGYVIDDFACDQKDIKLTIIDGKYYLDITSADITAAKVAVALKEIEPAEGYAIVVPGGDPIYVKYRSWEYNEETKEFDFLKVLDINTVNQVKIGDYVEVYRTDGMSVFKSITVNGKEVEDISERSIKFKVEGRMEINAVCETPVYVYSQSVNDPNKHIPMGTLQFEVDGKQVKTFYAKPGMTVKIIPMPEKGYIFEYAELFYSLDMAAEGRKIEGDTYTFTEEDCKQSMLLIQGVFKVDENEKTYVVRGSTAWIIDANGNVVENTSSAIGTVVMLQGDGSYAREFTGLEGESVKLEIAVNDEEIAKNYEVAGFCLMAGFPNSKISDPYVINPADADGTGVIWVCGLMRSKDSAVDEIAGETFRYDAAKAAIYAADGVKVFGINGELLIDSAEAETSVEGLVSGVYVAVSNGKTIKFVKK